MFEIEVCLSLPDVNDDPIDASCIKAVLEVEWEGEGELEYINVRNKDLPPTLCEWLSRQYEELYGCDKLFRAQIDAAIQQDIQWVKENNFREPDEPDVCDRYYSDDSLTGKFE